MLKDVVNARWTSLVGHVKYTPRAHDMDKYIRFRALRAETRKRTRRALRIPGKKIGKPQTAHGGNFRDSYVKVLQTNKTHGNMVTASEGRRVIRISSHLKRVSAGRHK